MIKLLSHKKFLLLHSHKTILIILVVSRPLESNKSKNLKDFDKSDHFALCAFHFWFWFYSTIVQLERILKALWSILPQNGGGKADHCSQEELPT